jgi:hypothetical protein
MTFKKWSLAITTLMLVAPLSASALGISIASPAGPQTLSHGDSITIDLVIENATNEDITGLGLGVFGYDTGAQGNASDNRLRFVSGQNSASVLNSFFVSPGVTTDGIGRVGPVAEDGAPFPLSDTLRVQLYEGVATTPSNGDGTFDTGINGLQTNGSDVHFQVTFQANCAGCAVDGSVSEDVTLVFGTGQFGNAALTTGGGTLAFSNSSLVVTVIPEPGTALLMGLGLTGLAVRRR